MPWITLAHDQIDSTQNYSNFIFPNRFYKQRFDFSELILETMTRFLRINFYEQRFNSSKLILRTMIRFFRINFKNNDSISIYHNVDS